MIAADLSDYNEELHRRVLTSPATCLPPFEEALEEFIRNRSPKVCAWVAACGFSRLGEQREERLPAQLAASANRRQPWRVGWVLPAALTLPLSSHANS